MEGKEKAVSDCDDYRSGKIDEAVGEW